MTEPTRAPWAFDEVINLNRFQVSGVMHPFTCPDHSQRAPLVATEEGWRCPTAGCEYRQDWAHDFMLNGEAVAALGEMHGRLAIEAEARASAATPATAERLETLLDDHQPIGDPLRCDGDDWTPSDGGTFNGHIATLLASLFATPATTDRVQARDVQALGDVLVEAMRETTQPVGDWDEFDWAAYAYAILKRFRFPADPGPEPERDRLAARGQALAAAHSVIHSGERCSAQLHDMIRSALGSAAPEGDEQA